eukprot:TRINITY_DN90449_c0_g1_i1.p1 TRINITY_DN90449_c0_g1~~TRINITY_DN90449_c0_g1_i1.p1  ORF type:complete len:317 (+),score=75.08 TRINITY_DN90449_c0_g1_i1:57-1007(+)
MRMQWLRRWPFFAAALTGSTANAKGSGEVCSEDGTCSAAQLPAQPAQSSLLDGEFDEDEPIGPRESLHEIWRRCEALGKRCGLYLNPEMHEQISKCVGTKTQPEEKHLEVCLERIQETLILDACVRDKVIMMKDKRCTQMLDMLVFNLPMPPQNIMMLSVAIWQQLFIKIVETHAALKSYDKATGLFYPRPDDTEGNAKHGRIAYGHRITGKEAKKNTFKKGVTDSAARALLRNDMKEATRILGKELGKEAMSRLRPQFAAVATDVAYRFGTTKGYKELMEGLKSGDLAAIKAELLKEPIDYRLGVLYKEFIATDD